LAKHLNSFTHFLCKEAELSSCSLPHPHAFKQQQETPRPKDSSYNNENQKIIEVLTHFSSTLPRQDHHHHKLQQFHPTSHASIKPCSLGPNL
jgi:hypothetical protein